MTSTATKGTDLSPLMLCDIALHTSMMRAEKPKQNTDSKAHQQSRHTASKISASLPVAILGLQTCASHVQTATKQYPTLPKQDYKGLNSSDANLHHLSASETQMHQVMAMHEQS